jgi:hypothetical protein
MKHTTVKDVSELVAGDCFMAYGEEWQVERLVFDPIGNTGNQPRYLIYTTDHKGAFGRLVGSKITTF